jgi:DNA-directed RNA polymerase subunit M/transcription elongation factor TFIIS
MYRIKDSESFRKSICSKIAVMIHPEHESTSQIDNMIINLEKGIYNYTIQESDKKKIIKKWENTEFVQIYLNRLRSVFVNLKNPGFLEKIRNREIEAKKVAFMTHQEMNPEKWRDLIQKQRLIEANKLENNIEASTDMFTCRKCRSKKCTYYEAQTRSGDEASTIFVTCLDCGKNWTC